MTDFNWYTELNQPFLSPPTWVFSPVWLILYIMIASSLIIYLAKKYDESKVNDYIWFFAQIILNLLWSPAFFILKNLWFSFSIVVLLDIAVYFTIKNFFKVSKFAAYLLIPYFLWILFATYLNFGLIALNY